MAGVGDLPDRIGVVQEDGLAIRLRTATSEDRQQARRRASYEKSCGVACVAERALQDQKPGRRAMRDEEFVDALRTAARSAPTSIAGATWSSAATPPPTRPPKPPPLRSVGAVDWRRRADPPRPPAPAPQRRAQSRGSRRSARRTPRARAAAGSATSSRRRRRRRLGAARGGCRRCAAVGRALAPSSKTHAEARSCQRAGAAVQAVARCVAGADPVTKPQVIACGLQRYQDAAMRQQRKGRWRA